MTSCQPSEVLKISEVGVSASGVESKGSHAEAQRSQRRGQCRSRQPLRTLRLGVKQAFEFRDSTAMAKSGKSKTRSCFSSPPKLDFCHLWSAGIHHRFAFSASCSDFGRLRPTVSPAKSIVRREIKAAINCRSPKVAAKVELSGPAEKSRQWDRRVASVFGLFYQPSPEADATRLT